MPVNNGHASLESTKPDPGHDPATTSPSTASPTPSPEQGLTNGQARTLLAREAADERLTADEYMKLRDLLGDAAKQFPLRTPTTVFKGDLPSGTKSTKPKGRRRGYPSTTDWPPNILDLYANHPDYYDRPVQGPKTRSDFLRQSSQRRRGRSRQRQGSTRRRNEVNDNRDASPSTWRTAKLDHPALAAAPPTTSKLPEPPSASMAIIGRALGHHTVPRAERVGQSLHNLRDALEFVLSSSHGLVGLRISAKA